VLILLAGGALVDILIAVYSPVRRRSLIALNSPPSRDRSRSCS
jgi:hypothetical protein